MKAEGVAVKVAPSLLSGGGIIRWWRSLCSLITGYRGVTPVGVWRLRRQHTVVAFAMLTDRRLSRCNPLRGMATEAVASGGGVRFAHRPPVTEV